MAASARTFEYAVELDTDWTATSDRGGGALPLEEPAWSPEHLLLTALCRCTLTSLRHPARRAGIDVASQGRARGIVAWREADSRFAFVSVDADLVVALDPPPDPDGVRELLAKAERDCFVGASLTAPPTYRWTVNGKEIA